MTSQGGGLNENYEYFLGNMDIHNMYSNRGFESHPLRHFVTVRSEYGLSLIIHLFSASISFAGGA